MNDKAYAEKRDGHKWNPVLIAVISSIIGSGGGVALVFNTPFGQSFARPDPYTGTQAASLIRRFDMVESSMNKHIREHPDLSNRYDRRIATLEAQYEIIIKNQDRILGRLNAR